MPLADWLHQLKDKTVNTQIRLRLRRLEMGNPGDCVAVGDGVRELRIHRRSGYRVYFAQHGRELVLLLCGGNKDSQQSDIDKAKWMWADWKERSDETIQDSGIASQGRG